MNRWYLIVLTSLFALSGCLESKEATGPLPNPEDDPGEFAPGPAMSPGLDGSADDTEAVRNGRARLGRPR